MAVTYASAFGLVKDVAVPAIILAMLVLIGNWPDLWRAIRFRRKAHWALVRATVEEVVALRSLVTDGSYSTYKTEIGYSYSFSGHYYSGHYLWSTCASEDEAYKLAQEYPKGMVLPARVHPTKPEVSVLILDDWDYRRSVGPAKRPRDRSRSR
jgi:hypothetical protein